MKKKLLIASIFVISILALTACANTPVASSEGEQAANYILVTGTGSVKVVPDIAYINIGVRNSDESVTVALDENTLQAQAIRDELIALGVAEEDIQTSSFNVYPQNNYDFEGNITSTTFVVENNVYVTVRDLDGMGEMLGKVTESGANSIYGITFDVVDKTAALDQSRELAIANARTQAEQVAAVSGVKLGDIISIDVYSSDAPVIMDMYGIGGAGAVYPLTSAKVPISAGSYVINASITIKYALD